MITYMFSFIGSYSGSWETQVNEITDEKATSDPTEENLDVRDMISNLEILLKRESNKNYLRQRPDCNACDCLIWRINNDSQLIIQDCDIDIINILEDEDGFYWKTDPAFFNTCLFREIMKETYGPIKMEDEIKLLNLSLMLIYINMYSYTEFVGNFCPKKKLKYGIVTIRNQGYRKNFSVIEQGGCENIPFKYKYKKNNVEYENISLKFLGFYISKIPQNRADFDDIFSGVENLASRCENHDVAGEIYKLLESDLSYDNYYSKIFGSKAKSANF